MQIKPKLANSLLLWGLVYFFCACSSENKQAPRSGRSHVDNYALVHARAAMSDTSQCQLCHGSDYSGDGGSVPSCFSCHESGPPFQMHALPYTDPQLHGAAAKADQVRCRGCHGLAPNNFDGGIVSDPSSYNNSFGACSNTLCHPDAKAHPTRWQGTNDDSPSVYNSSHQNVAQETAENSCSLCHNIDSAGTGPMTAAPSCYSATFTNADGVTSGCHASGPYFSSPHNDSFSEASSHGAAAKSDLAYCQQCHGVPGTTRFANGSAFVSCASDQCHGAAAAHPTRWQGTNDNTGDYTSTHRTAANQSTTCTICHDYTQNRVAPNASAPSCFSASFTNSDGSTTGCHSSGPGTGHEHPFTEASIHGPVAKADLSACQQCHGDPGTTQFSGGAGSSVSCAASGCHSAAAEAHPTRWQGTNDNTSGYTSSHRTADYQGASCTVCHDVTQGRSAPNSQAPSCYSASFTNADGTNTSCHPGGPSRPHPLPFTDSSLHGPEAMINFVFCQGCHADPAGGAAGSNPRFNVNVGDLVLGCEDCHEARSAHPVSSTWIVNHRGAGNVVNACTLCHGANLLGAAEGGVGGACGSCHKAGLPTVLANCTSCHNKPPNGASPAGNVRPNRNGAHAVHNDFAGITGVCTPCHNGFGTTTDNHYDTSSPANVSGLSTYNAKSGTFTYTSSSGICTNVSCHGAKATPVWISGTLDVNTQCTSCHASGTAQYNSYNSGKHSKHSGEAACYDCHDTTKLATKHFTGLSTAAFEGVPGQTIKTSIGYNATTRRCSTPCHGPENW